MSRYLKRNFLTIEKKKKKVLVCFSQQKNDYFSESKGQLSEGFNRI